MTAENQCSREGCRGDISKESWRISHAFVEQLKRRAIKVRRLTAVQRVLSRFGNPKVPNSLITGIDKAKSLRGIAASLVGIHDTLRYIINFTMSRNRFAHVCLC